MSCYIELVWGLCLRLVFVTTDMLSKSLGDGLQRVAKYCQRSVRRFAILTFIIRISSHLAGFISFHTSQFLIVVSFFMPWVTEIELFELSHYMIRGMKSSTNEEVK